MMSVGLEEVGQIVALLRAAPDLSGREVAKRLGRAESSIRPFIKQARKELARRAKEDPVAYALPAVDPSTLDVGAPFLDLFPISDSQLATIEESMIGEGYHPGKPIEVWREKNLIVDGHTRQKAAIKAGVDVTVCYYDFDDEDEALAHAIAAQRNRRNLDTATLLRCIAAVDRKKAKGEVAPIGARPDDGEHGKSAAETASVVGTSVRQVERARKVLANPEVAEKVNSGEIKSLHKAEKAVREAAKPKPERNGSSHVHEAPDGLSEEETYLQSCPVRKLLDDRCRETFDRDALAFRRAEKHISALKSLGLSEDKKSGVTQGAFQAVLSRFLRTAYPNAWLQCQSVSPQTGQKCIHGQLGDGSTCGSCRGRGYVMP